MNLKYNQYIHQEVKETYNKHINFTKEIHNCTKSSETIGKEFEQEIFDFDRDKLQGTQL